MLQASFSQKDLQENGMEFAKSTGGEVLAYFMTIAPLNSCKGHPRFITFNKQHNFELELSLNVQVVVSGELAENMLNLQE